LFLNNLPAALAFILWAFLANALRADEPARYIGRASCGSATCHGGIQGQGPEWHSSLRSWEANDVYHAYAGQVLMNGQSKRMVMGLARDLAYRGSTDEEVHDRILKDRCVSCHAPSLASIAQTPDGNNWLVGIREGVSCEACHGPASNWLSQHTLVEPDHSKLAASGKLATLTWRDRTDNCLRCHVGSRTQAGIIRDVNHDLIAAGHPALLFDMSQAQFKLPAHWNVSDSKRFRTDRHLKAIKSPPLPSNKLTPEKLAPEFELAAPDEHYQARARVLAAVTRLSMERHAASSAGRAPWPELAEYNCDACHQSIHYQSPLALSRSQQLSWNTFYTQQPAIDSNLFPTANDRMQMGGEEMLSKLFVLSKESESKELKPLDTVAALSRASEQAILQRSSPNWQLAANWLWSNRLMVLNAGPKTEAESITSPARLSADDASELTELLDEFGLNMEFNSQSSARPSDLNLAVTLGTVHVNFDRLVSLRDQYRSKLASILNRSGDPPVAGANR
jgi:cytochrome c5